MPPRTTKRKSAASDSATPTNEPNFAPEEPQAVPANMSSPSRMPVVRSPSKRASSSISLAQKQAILDNLQEEITVRARRLRAQYNLQAEGLRARVQFRVNRIPVALRKQKLGDLIKKYSEQAAKSSGPQRTASGRPAIQGNQVAGRTISENLRNNKRPSDAISTDKENDEVANSKKRLRGPLGAVQLKNSKPDIHPSQILSPKSSNSHIQPKFPAARPTELGKAQLARPVSPLKPGSPAKPSGAAGLFNSMVDRAKSTRAGGARKAAVPPLSAPPPTTAAGRGARKAPVPKAPTRAARARASDASESSAASSGTVIVTKPAPAKKAPAKRTVMSTIKGIGGGKKAPAPKATVPAAGRVLRTRK